MLSLHQSEQIREKRFEWEQRAAKERSRERWQEALKADPGGEAEPPRGTQVPLRRARTRILAPFHPAHTGSAYAGARRLEGGRLSPAAGEGSRILENNSNRRSRTSNNHQDLLHRLLGHNGQNMESFESARLGSGHLGSAGRKATLERIYV